MVAAHAVVNVALVVLAAVNLGDASAAGAADEGDNEEDAGKAQRHLPPDLDHQLRRHRFHDWLARHDARFDGLELHTFASGLRGLRTLRPLYAGEFMLTLPDALCLSEASAARSAVRGAVERLRANGTRALGGEIVLALQLAHEQHAGRGSFWSPYIDVLPPTACMGGSSAYFGAAALGVLGEVEARRAMELRRNLQHNYDVLDPVALSWRQPRPCGRRGDGGARGGEDAGGHECGGDGATALACA